VRGDSDSDNSGSLRYFKEVPTGALSPFPFPALSGRSTSVSMTS
jgi:hypothetical protein